MHIHKVAYVYHTRAGQKSLHTQVGGLGSTLGWPLPGCPMSLWSLPWTISVFTALNQQSKGDQQPHADAAGSIQTGLTTLVLARLSFVTWLSNLLLHLSSTTSTVSCLSVLPPYRSVSTSNTLALLGLGFLALGPFLGECSMACSPSSIRCVRVWMCAGLGAKTPQKH
jgi:hypothetical protein